MITRASLIALLMLSYVTAPVFDAVACDDCSDPVLVQHATEVLQPLPGLAGEAGRDGNHASPSRGTAKDLCPLCANAAVGISVVNWVVPCETMQCAAQPKLLAFSDPSYPITKPPQN